MLKTIRRVLAVVFWLGITLLFLDFTGTVQPFLGWMAKLQFLPSVLAANILSIVLVLAVTLLLGRIYCSVVCPLGVMQDFFAWIGRWRVFRKNKKARLANKYSHSKEKKWLTQLARIQTRLSLSLSIQQEHSLLLVLEINQLKSGILLHQNKLGFGRGKKRKKKSFIV